MEEKVVGKNCPHCGYDDLSGPESSHHLPTGTILQEKYLLGKVLGQGGFGITYIARDLTLDLKLAIKEFFPLGLVVRATGQSKMEIPTGERGDQYRYGLDRYLEEAKTLARFSEYPNTVTVRDFFKANSTAYMVMNYIEGLTLEAYLKQAGGKIAFTKTLEIMMPVLDALREVHEEGFMHRDISPDNILINKKGRVILIDFGAARQEMREKSKSLSVILKAGYAPEEQYRSRGKQGPWTDIYAVAATMYRCITGQVPPEAMDRLAEDDLVTPSKLGVNISEDKEAALLKALTVRAEGRFQVVEDFQTALLSSNTIKEAVLPVKEKKISAASPVMKRTPVIDGTSYFIDYTGGTIPIGDLPIGTRVVDPTWQWEFKTGDNYTGTGELKPVTWLVVAKDHYDIKEPHVTLLAEELIGKYLFDNSKGWMGLISGKNHWGASGKGKNDRGLRPWLNSTGIHMGEGFYRTFSERFKQAVLTTNLPNRKWAIGSAYNTEDKVFLPSTTELGDAVHRYTYRVGTTYPYFQGTENPKRVACLNDKAQFYWTRSPGSVSGDAVCYVFQAGGFYYSFAKNFIYGVRPALNLKSEILVSKIV
jgi:serine/threonine protein kinase